MSFVSFSRSFGRCINELFDFKHAAQQHLYYCRTSKKKNITDSMITSRYVTVLD